MLLKFLVTSSICAGFIVCAVRYAGSLEGGGGFRYGDWLFLSAMAIFLYAGMVSAQKK